MNCPICGKGLSTLTALLADTEVGAQCPNCWTQLRGKNRLLKPAQTKGRTKTEKLRRVAA